MGLLLLFNQPRRVNATAALPLTGSAAVGVAVIGDEISALPFTSVANGGVGDQANASGGLPLAATAAAALRVTADQIVSLPFTSVANGGVGDQANAAGGLPLAASAAAVLSVVADASAALPIAGGADASIGAVATTPQSGGAHLPWRTRPARRPACVAAAHGHLALVGAASAGVAVAAHAGAPLPFSGDAQFVVTDDELAAELLLLYEMAA